MGESATQETGPLDLTCSDAMCAHEGTYTLSAGCYNCDWTGTVLLTRGHEFRGWNEECPSCGCRRLFHRTSYRDSASKEEQ